jgi:hypothetical protein
VGVSIEARGLWVETNEEIIRGRRFRECGGKYRGGRSAAGGGRRRGMRLRGLNFKEAGGGLTGLGLWKKKTG